MTSLLLEHITKCSMSSFGNNLLCLPSRIIPVSSTAIIDDKPSINIDKIRYLTPCQEEMSLGCNPTVLLSEPSAYFLEPHSFLQSVLYLVSPEFYKICIYSRKKDAFLVRFINDTFSEYIKDKPKKEIRDVKKLMQHLLISNWTESDTDPAKNTAFPVLYRVLSSIIKDKIIVIHSDKNGYFNSITPTNILKDTLFDIEKTENRIILLCQLPNGRFSPYGISYLTLKDKSA